MTVITPACCGCGDDNASDCLNLTPARKTAVPSVTEPPSTAEAKPPGSDDALVPAATQKKMRPAFAADLTTCPSA